MTNREFSDQFDVLYNSITSNQAPGLDEYEKSVFLTKAQDEIVKSYFDPRSNKTQEGYDDNEKRQIDFSMIMRSHAYQVRDILPDFDEITKSVSESVLTDTSATVPGGTETSAINPFLDSFFDMRDNTKAVDLENDIMMFINEYVEVKRSDYTARLTVLPINYVEYSRLMSKPYKRPNKNQAWRLLDNSSGKKRAEIVVGPNDIIKKYVIRYVKRPRAIILAPLDDTSIDSYVGFDSNGNLTKEVSNAVHGTYEPCELDPILHEEILQRAVELAKASYIGDLQSQLALGQASQTNIGAIQTASRQ